MQAWMGINHESYSMFTLFTCPCDFVVGPNITLFPAQTTPVAHGKTAETAKFNTSSVSMMDSNRQATSIDVMVPIQSHIHK